ncbi:MAG: DNA internalization-related competence protein ComEC/Rec2 [Desulfamplus sp.]|nr:DNA internalization-related competence protein ComEC/Rec2 [Desulfamplus sp.]
MRIFFKYGIPPLIPLFFFLCITITAANYLPVFNGTPLFDLFDRLPENHVSKFVDKGIMNITGTVVSKPEKFDNQSENLDKSKQFIADNNSKNEKSNNKKSDRFDIRVRFDLSVENIVPIDAKSTQEVNQTDSKKVSGTVQMNVYNPLVQYKQGDTIQFKGKVKSLRNFNNPGGFDYVRYMQNRGLWGRVNANGKDIVLSNLHKADSQSLVSQNFAVHTFLNSFRDDFTIHIFNNLKDKDSGAILCALIAGNTGFISKELALNFSATGVSHVLSVSGLHLSIVATLFFYLFNMSLSCFNWILIRGWSRKMAALLTIIPIVGYALLSGNSDATQRSMIMIIIFMTAAIVERESDMFNSLAAAGIIILLFDPLSLFAVSFQLSFSAVFFILMGLSLSKEYRVEIGEKLNKINNKSGNRFNFLIQNRFFKIFVSFIFISICATAGTQILVMHYFNLFSFSGILANFVIVPGVGFAALYLGLAALFFYPFSAVVSGFLIKCSGFILTPCITFIRTIANLTGSYTETFTPDIVEITCYYLFIGFLFIVARSWRKRSVSFRIGVLGAAVSSLIFLIYEGVWINKRFFNDNLSVTVLDVGQGNSALIEMPKGKTILVDGGGFSYIGSFDTGANIIAPFLRQKKIMTLDAVVLTHPDSDHLNGLVYIVEHFKVNKFIKNRDEQDNSAYKNLMTAIEKIGSLVITIDDNAKPLKIGNVELYFFNPLKSCSNKLYETLSHKSYEENINDNSIVFKLLFGQTSILFPGDITKKAETEIVDKYKNESAENIKFKDAGYPNNNMGYLQKDINYLKSDILISPHHGSAGSSSDFFLDMVAPESIIISCGWQNRFGFPRTIVLNSYQNRGIKIFRTDLNGAVTLSSDGTAWEIHSFL